MLIYNVALCVECTLLSVLNQDDFINSLIKSL